MNIISFVGIRNNFQQSNIKNKDKIYFSGSGLRKIYPKLEPYDTFRLSVSKIHDLYVERSGKKNGEPIVFLHGGPGQGIDSEDRRWFNPNFFDSTLFDQRGAGKSTPSGEIRDNSTNFLIEDMEKLREHLGVKKWSLYGISWGATLGLRYAAAYPDRVSGMVLRGVTPNPQNAVNWLFKEGGCSQFFTEAWQKFKNFIPEKERDNLLEAYYKRLSSRDPNVNIPATKAYDEWGYSHLKVDDENNENTHEITQQNVNASKIECFYFLNNCFTSPEDLKGLKSLKNIPIEVIQGRYDMIAPPYNAIQVKELIPNSNVHVNIVKKTGHSTTDPRITNAELTALDNLETYLTNK